MSGKYTELHSCPFCGRNSHLCLNQDTDIDGTVIKYIYCGWCGARKQYCEIINKYSSWNDREQEKQLLQQLQAQRQENEELKQQISSNHLTIESKIRTIENLTNEREELDKESEELEKHYSLKDAECNQLKEQRDYFKGKVENFESIRLEHQHQVMVEIPDLIQQNTKLQSERDRYREVLEEVLEKRISEIGYYDEEDSMIQTIEQALETKEGK